MNTATNQLASTQESADEEMNMSQSDLISLMNVYSAEWCHREASMLKQMASYYIGVFIMMLLPHIHPLGLEFPSVISQYILEALGICLTLFILYTSFIYTDRLYIVGEAYRRIMKLLPEPYRQKEISNKSILRIHVIKIICIFITLFQVFLGISYLFAHELAERG